MSTFKVFASLFIIATLLQSCLAAPPFILTVLPLTIPIGLNPNNACYKENADSIPICDWNTLWLQLPIPFLNAPGPGDDVILTPSTPITLQISNAVSINSLQISQSTSLTVSAAAVLNIAQNVTVSASSTLTVAGQLAVAQATTVAGQLIIVVGGAYTGAVSVANTAVLTVDDQTQAAATTSAQLIITANSDIRGTVNFGTRAFLNVTQAAAFWANQAITFYGSANIDADASITIVNSNGWTQSNGTITINGYITTSVLNNLGTIQGNGAINGTVYNAGTLSPGNSPGTIVINGDYHQTDSGTYKFEIESANSYDRIIVTGTAYRAGVLYANIINGYTPSPHESFTVISHHHAQGTYTFTRGNMNDATFTQFSTQYTDTQTTLIFSGAVSTFVATSLVFLPLLAVLLL
eukprot:TRINITY_DN1649_c0_g1_i2.p1 TRINITY_DN1649_c0_g1~~TRINITY_DN1649_c0_g1_i2.p1  ORF type:complete len:408 (-),score=92.16 TRINITY_DN1649_c0_g1_i2:72-1295(-)